MYICTFADVADFTVYINNVNVIHTFLGSYKGLESNDGDFRELSIFILQYVSTFIIYRREHGND